MSHIRRLLDEITTSTVLLLLLLPLVGCGQSTISAEISRQAASGDGRLNLTTVGGRSWDRLCFLGPYTTNAFAEQTLGFPWDAEARTAIELSDAINVLVFVAGREVVAYTEHSRQQDFARLNGKCFARSEAKFVKQAGGYVQLGAE